MYIYTFYAYFVHFSADSITYTIDDKMAVFRPKMCHFVASSRARWPLKCSTKKGRETIAHYKTPYIKCTLTPYVSRIYTDI